MLRRRRRSGSSSPPPAPPTPTFNWAIVIGDVVRVVLLFYLMPLWTVLLARAGPRRAADEARRRCASALGATGAAIVLWPPAASDRRRAASPTLLPLPRSLADWLGVVGGFSFAFNNVMLRREASRPEEGRALAMFVGGALVAGALAAVLTDERRGRGAAARRRGRGWR